MKRIIFLVLALCMLTLCGCSNNNSESSSGFFSDFTKQTDNRTSLEKMFDTPVCVAVGEKTWKYGYINQSGEYVIEPKFTNAEKFSKNGLAFVGDSETGNIGYIDTKGNWAIEPIYKKGLSFGNNGLAFVSKDGIFWGLINEKGDYVVEPKFMNVNEFKDGLALVSEDGRYWSYIDEKGKYLFEPQYTKISEYIDGLAIAEVDGYKFFIDEKGKNIFNNNWHEVYPFVEDIAIVCVNGAYGYIDKNGKYLLEPIVFGELTNFSEGRAFRKDYHGQYYMIDKEMNVLTEPIYDLNGTRNLKCNDGYYLVRRADKESYSSYTYLDKNGNEILPKDGTYYKVATRFQNGLAIVCEADSEYCGYINTDGDYFIKPTFPSATEFKGDIAYVSTEKNGLLPKNYKYIDKSGNIVVEYDNDDFMLREMHTENIYVIQNHSTGAVGFIDKAGNNLTDCIYEDTEYYMPTDESYIKVKYNGLWGMIDKNGNWIVQPKYAKFIG